MSSVNITERLRITAPAALAERLELALAALAHAYSSWQPAGSDQGVYEAYFECADDATRAANRLTHQLTDWTGSDAWRIVQESMPTQDWAHAWKAFFHVERVSRRIIVRPSWESYTAAPGDCVITLDPGMSFGTGQHETTRGCLRFLDMLTDGPDVKSFLDLGCGSGILAIAAALLGCQPVAALDIDPEAVTSTLANRRVNACTETVSVRLGDVATPGGGPDFDIVAANILAPVLIEHAMGIAHRVTPGGHLLLAGILTGQYPAVRDAYLPLGFDEIGTINDGEWTSIHLCRQSGEPLAPDIGKQEQ